LQQSRKKGGSVLDGVSSINFTDMSSGQSVVSSRSSEGKMSGSSRYGELLDLHLHHAFLYRDLDERILPVEKKVKGEEGSAQRLRHTSRSGTIIGHDGLETEEDETDFVIL